MHLKTEASALIVIGYLIVLTGHGQGYVKKENGGSYGTIVDDFDIWEDTQTADVIDMLLDTGFFHADPHPGNLIRTPDGKLAILDFGNVLDLGLVTKLTDDQKYGMIEAIAHLIHRDYGAIVKDFVKLGFMPEGVNLEPILPVLAKVFDQALEGGGAKNISFQELASDLAQITFDYPFRIPPYFALII
ncbi:hypothetical protein Cgig2_017250 [Carnegiea gigantea]|uniref:ABC1 atypical kinase-like domain-containing protein n=1 Tax=Carnegiea gigantea TaxID=171969 RepID=A0A9Q1GYL4_9CARY|nr:hypothetical protein Cgig2_017250 [Carnegiea gigantea]